MCTDNSLPKKTKDFHCPRVKSSPITSFLDLVSSCALALHECQMISSLKTK